LLARGDADGWVSPATIEEQLGYQAHSLITELRQSAVFEEGSPWTIEVDESADPVRYRVVAENEPLAPMLHRAGTIRTAQTWLNRNRELGSAGRSNVEVGREDQPAAPAPTRGAGLRAPETVVLRAGGLSFDESSGQ